MRKLVIVIYLISIILFSSGSVLEIKNEKALLDAKKNYNSLFADNLPKDNITVSNINEVVNSINEVSEYNRNTKNEMLDDLIQYKKYISIKDDISNKYIGEAVSESITDEDINSLTLKTDALDEKYRSKLKTDIEDIQKQKQALDNIKTRIRDLYYEGDLTNVKAEITIVDVENIKADLEKIPQKDYVNKRKALLDEAINKIAERERINNAWVYLNTPYISQNKNNVLNGCEAAALLMALQYKGYLKNTSLYEYATNMPKSTNPYEGFTYDIYVGEPYNVPHWIAPEPLAKYGRESSGNQNIINGTGKSIDELDRELDNGNPVVIYLTAKFKTPRDWKEDAPTNLHVLLLVGYNKITQEHIIIDPWTHDDGRTRWTVSKNQLETIYNAVGKRNVIVR